MSLPIRFFNLPINAYQIMDLWNRYCHQLNHYEPFGITIVAKTDWQTNLPDYFGEDCSERLSPSLMQVGFGSSIEGDYGGVMNQQYYHPRIYEWRKGKGGKQKYKISWIGKESTEYCAIKTVFFLAPNQKFEGEEKYYNLSKFKFIGLLNLLSFNKDILASFVQFNCFDVTEMVEACVRIKNGTISIDGTERLSLQSMT